MLFEAFHDFVATARNEQWFLRRKQTFSIRGKKFLPKIFEFFSEKNSHFLTTLHYRAICCLMYISVLMLSQLIINRNNSHNIDYVTTNMYVRKKTSIFPFMINNSACLCTYTDRFMSK